MPAFFRALVLCLAASAMLAVSAAALASDDVLVLATEAESESAPDAPAFPSGITPAEEADTSGPDEEEPPWTTRFLAPLVLTIGLGGLLVSLLVYMVRLKTRYRVVR